MSTPDFDGPPVSRDGNFWWDGHRWQLLPGAQPSEVDTQYVERRLPWLDRKIFFGVLLSCILVFVGVLTTFEGRDQQEAECLAKQSNTLQFDSTDEGTQPPPIADC